MAKPHGRTADGRPANLIGQPLDVRPSPPPQPFIVTKEAAMAQGKTAPSDGVYTLNGGRFRIRKGDVLPEGAEFAERTPVDPEARALKSAPENKSKAGAPENRAKKAD
jgi:hypothetical protein